MTWVFRLTGRALPLQRARPGAARAWVHGARRLPHLTLFSGTDCQLCDEAKEVLDEVRARQPFSLRVYNIRDDAEANVHYWRRKYQYDIPVLHVRDEGVPEGTEPGADPEDVGPGAFASDRVG